MRRERDEDVEHDDQVQREADAIKPRRRRKVNRVDEVLGFQAPKWVDEIVTRRKIDRREGRPEDIEQALRAEVIEHEGRLIAALRASEDLARMLGHAVAAADLRSMHKQLQRTPPALRAFYSHPRDPRSEP